MNHINSIICLLLILASNCIQIYAQNQANEIFISDTIHYSCLASDISEGYTKVIAIDTLDIISESPTDFIIRYQDTTAKLHYSNRQDNSITVKNGLWHTYDNNGSADTSYWFNGIRLWFKLYLFNGGLVIHNNQDLHKDVIFHDYYINDHLFHRRFHLPKDENNAINLYYPNENIGLNQGRLRLETNFLYRPVDTEELNIFCKKTPLTIQGINHTNPFLKITDSEGQTVPQTIRLTPADTLSLRFTYTPSPKQANISDTVYILTDQGNYPILIYMGAYHVDSINLKKLKKLELSQSKDQYFNLANLGDRTQLRIRKRGATSLFKGDYLRTSWKPIQVDLSTLSIGIHKLRIGYRPKKRTILLNVVE